MKMTLLLACRCKAWIWGSSKSALAHTQSLVNEVQGPEDVVEVNKPSSSTDSVATATPEKPLPGASNRL